MRRPYPPATPVKQLTTFRIKDKALVGDDGQLSEVSAGLHSHPAQ
jgi:hypothetical protein